MHTLKGWPFEPLDIRPDGPPDGNPPGVPG